MLWKLLAADIERVEGIGAVGAVLFLTSSCFFSIIISVILSTPDNFNLFLPLGFLFQVQYLTLCNLLHNHIIFHLRRSFIYKPKIIIVFMANQIKFIVTPVSNIW